MKKKIVLVIIALSAYCISDAQISRNALGVRFGGGSFLGAEVSYQHGFSDRNRLELDLGFGGNKNYSVIGVAGIYQWAWNIKNGFYWFVGPGAALSMNSGKDDHDDYFGLAIGGQIGIEYNFKIPLQISLDTRPMWDFLVNDGADAFGWGLSLGLRYRF